jgi:hypothetical protein
MNALRIPHMNSLSLVWLPVTSNLFHYFLWNYHFLFLFSLCTPSSSGTNVGRKTRARCGIQLCLIFRWAVWLTGVVVRLQAGLKENRGWIALGKEHFLFTCGCRPTVGFTLSSIQWAQDSLSRRQISLILALITPIEIRRPSKPDMYCHKNVRQESCCVVVVIVNFSRVCPYIECKIFHEYKHSVFVSFNPFAV